MMDDKKYASHFSELVIYQYALRVAQDVFKLSQHFPDDERYSLTDQIRRSSRSIGAQIAEAWGKRRYPKHFVSKLTDSAAEQYETQHWLYVAQQCGYLQKNDVAELFEILEKIGKMLNTMIRKADSFCQKDKRYLIKEDVAVYGSNEELKEMRIEIAPRDINDTNQPQNTPYQSPVIDHQTPVTDHQTPITKHRSPNTKHRSPVTKHRSPNTKHQNQ